MKCKICNHKEKREIASCGEDAFCGWGMVVLLGVGVVGLIYLIIAAINIVVSYYS